MNKRKVGRLAGFLALSGATAGLIGVGVNMTGAFFQDTEQGSVQATTGEVDLTVGSGTPLTQSFGPLLPGEAGDTNTYDLQNVGTGPVDFYVASANWNASLAGVANPGTTISNGVITADLTGQAGGTSYEWPDLDIPVAGGDLVTFQWRSSTSAACSSGGNGGVPRLFIQGGGPTRNSHDDLLATGGSLCGTAPDVDGWRTVTWSLPADVTGVAGYTGVVNDAVPNGAVIEYRNVVIGTTPLTDWNMCDPANDDLEVRVNSTTHDTGFQNLCQLSTGNAPILVSANVSPNSARAVDVTLRLNGAATNVWANRLGTADLIVIAVQAGSLPTNQADQISNDA